LEVLWSVPEWDDYVNDLTNFESCSHTPRVAFGCLFSQIKPGLRLTLGKHFPVADDTVACALKSVQVCFPKNPPIFGQDITWSLHLMVIRMFKDEIH
jgi:ribonuclease Z